MFSNLISRQEHVNSFSIFQERGGEADSHGGVQFVTSDFLGELCVTPKTVFPLLFHSLGFFQSFKILGHVFGGLLILQHSQFAAQQSYLAQAEVRKDSWATSLI